MATLLNLQHNQTTHLCPQHIFGRDNNSNTLLSNESASRIHASIFWDGHYWQLKDSSRNGTFVNGIPIPQGVIKRLENNNHINFGNIQSDTWQVINTSPPKPMLIPLSTKLETQLLDDMILLPNEDSPELMLYQCNKGEWVCESTNGISSLKTGDEIVCESGSWHFINPTLLKETLAIHESHLIQTTQIKTLFDVSQNEEHVSLTLKVADQEINLGQRNHHYLMLILARQRLSDQAAGFIKNEQGWIDKDLLSKSLGMDENHINIQIYRFRKQIVSALPTSIRLPQAIQRRTGEIRFAYELIEILGGACSKPSVSLSTSNA